MSDRYNQKPRVRSINPMQDDFNSMKASGVSPIKAGLGKLNAKANEFAAKEIANMNSKSFKTQIKTWGKLVLPISLYTLYKERNSKNIKKIKDTILGEE